MSDSKDIKAVPGAAGFVRTQPPVASRQPARYSRVSAAFVCALILAVGVAWFVASRSPAGHFDSTTLMGLHDSGDVLTFWNGTVSWETCCGDTPVGRFERLPNGIWAWYFVMGTKKPVTNELVLQPGFLWLSCYETGQPSKIYRLKRRLLAPKEAE